MRARARRLPGHGGRARGRRTPAALLFAVLALSAATACSSGRGPDPVPACTAQVPGSAPVVLDPEQARNAATIAAVGRRLGLADHAVTVALATAMQESKLRNLDHGDRDSVGLFQQRPSQGWGTAAQVAMPTYAAAAFYTRLEKVKGWETLAVTDAAQAVQHSAYPQAYGLHEDAARVLARATTGEVPASLACAHLAGTPVLRDADLQQAAGAELGAGALGSSGPRDRWAAASWLVAQADAFGLQSVTAEGQRWTRSAGAWAPDPAAGTTVTYR